MGVLKIILGVITLLATQELPYDYYQILRLIVFVFVIYFVFSEYKMAHKWIVGFYMISGLIFNPVLPLHFSKSTWVAIDIIVGALMTSIGIKNLINNIKGR